ncbi:MAG: 3-phosphoshikimate 1-carboxyvinyltransferase [Solirubrobacteraceae bacterium]
MSQRFAPTGPLRGELSVPADKSISQRAALIGAMCGEPVRIDNYLKAADTKATLAAARALGALVEVFLTGVVVRGNGPRGVRQPERAIDVQNAGTLLRLLPGWLAAQEGCTFTLDGDESIRRRPIDRVIAPLSAMGAACSARDDRFAPLEIEGRRLHGISYELPVASAQVKSCLLLAGLLADGETTVIEPIPSRDHTERMLLRGGAAVVRDGSRISIRAGQVPALERIVVPGDMSSAAFLIAAGILVEGSRVLLRDVGVNWTRTGFLQIVERMGASVGVQAEARSGALHGEEPVSDIEVEAGPLTGTVVEADEVPLAIDELPLVALLACFAEGETIVRGAGELRLKESDRISTVVDGLRGLGADIEATDDGFAVRGGGGLRGGAIEAHGDHRLAMVGAVAGLASREGVEVDGMEAASVSYPRFADDIRSLVGDGG